MTHDTTIYHQGTTRRWLAMAMTQGRCLAAFGCWDKILSIEDCQACQGRVFGVCSLQQPEKLDCGDLHPVTWRIKTRCVLLWQSSIAVEDFRVANDLRYLFKVRTKMRRDWRLQAIWHLRQIAHEQHPENLILMLGDHCKYPSYDVRSFHLKVRKIFTFAIIPQSIQKYPEKVTSKNLPLSQWCHELPPRMNSKVPNPSFYPSFLAKQLTQTGTIHPDLPDRYPCNH